MSMMDKLWDAFSTVIKMNDKVIAQAAAMAAQQAPAPTNLRRLNPEFPRGPVLRFA
jgi:hypothetical protein